MPTCLRTANFLNIDFVDATYGQVVAELDRLSREGGASLVVTPNVAHVVMLRDEASFDENTERFARAYEASSMRLCDSRILQALVWFQGINLQVVTESDLTALLFREG